jgi:hypothetical protein
MLDKIFRAFVREETPEEAPPATTSGPVVNVKNTFLHFKTTNDEDDNCSRRARSASPLRSAPRSEPEVVRVKPRRELKNAMKKIASAPVALCDLIHMTDLTDADLALGSRNAMSCHNLSGLVMGIEEESLSDMGSDMGSEMGGERSVSPASTFKGDDDMHMGTATRKLQEAEHQDAPETPSKGTSQVTTQDHTPMSSSETEEDSTAKKTLAFHIYDMMEQKGFGGTDSHLLMDVYMEVWTHLMGGATTGGKLALERFASFLIANDDLFEVFERRILRLPHSIELTTMKEKTASRFTHKERMVRLKERPGRTLVAAGA